MAPPGELRVNAGVVCWQVKLCDPHLSALEVRCSRRGAIQIDHLFYLFNWRYTKYPALPSFGELVELWIVRCSPQNGRAVLGDSDYGNATEGYWLTNVQCDGSESDVADCAHSPWGDDGGCEVTEPAGVSCVPDTPTPPPRTASVSYNVAYHAGKAPLY